jgi:hypothetical protein
MLEPRHLLFGGNQLGEGPQPFLQHRCGFVKVGNLIQRADLQG